MIKSIFLSLFSITVLYATTVKIMPLGDSITYDNRYADAENPRPIGKRTAYRSHLWYMLENAEYPADFVGSQVAGQDVTPPFDPDNEGHPGWKMEDIAQKTYTYMTQSNPDMVLLHIGTNDRATTNPSGVGDILDTIDLYEYNTKHHIKVFVALIIDRRENDGRTAIFNRRLNDLLNNRILSGDDIVIVNMHDLAGLTYSDYDDYTHPNDHGFYKMASVWYNFIVANPYDPKAPVYLPLKLYPETLVAKENILFQEIEGSTITFSISLPENGIEFK